MSESRTMFDFLRERGSAFITQVSNELMGNPAFLKAMETAYRGKERLDGAVAQALKTMNVPSRTEFKRAVARIDALERELGELRAKPSAPARAPRKKPAAPRRPRKKPAPPASA